MVFICSDVSLFHHIVKKLQSTLVISKLFSEILRDIHTSAYQIYRIEEKIINRTTRLAPVVFVLYLFLSFLIFFFFFFFYHDPL